ncbi:MAG TPA: hypothetical protein VD970_19645 [Acetobacteraceae bacterium]|nr:hypothetical protein [Acetobacteraceae bacterium]
MRIRGPVALLIVALAAPVRAEGLDCTGVATPLHRMVCADPDLLAVARRVEALSRDLSRAPWAAETAQRQEAFLNALPRLLGNPGALRAAYRERLQTLEREAIMAADPRLRALPEAVAGRDCLILPISVHADAPCRVVDRGALGDVDGRARRFLRYEYEGSDTGVLLVLGRGAADEPWRVDLVASSWDEECQPPRLLPGTAPRLLWRCTTIASGSPRHDRVWRPEGAAWHPLDVQGWRAALTARLGRQYALHRSPVVDYDRMATTVRLRSQDHGAGHWAEGRIELGWVADRLVLRRLDIVRLRD